MTPSDTGQRYNAGKPHFTLLFDARHAMIDATKVLEFGMRKYARGNWLKGLPWTEIEDSLLRHLSAFHAGEDTDPESGLPHTAHVLVNALFLAEMFHRKNLDDRSTKPAEPITPAPITPDLARLFKTWATDPIPGLPVNDLRSKVRAAEPGEFED